MSDIQRQFKVGDWVIRLKDGHPYNPLTIGRAYKVQRVHIDTIELIDDNSDLKEYDIVKFELSKNHIVTSILNDL